MGENTTTSVDAQAVIDRLGKVIGGLTTQSIVLETRLEAAEEHARQLAKSLAEMQSALEKETRKNSEDKSPAESAKIGG